MRNTAVVAALALLGVGAAISGYVVGRAIERPGIVVSDASTPAPARVAVLSGDGLFSANCGGCHGARAQGGVGPKLAGLVKGWDEQTFRSAVLDGKGEGGRALAPMMPRFGSTGLGGHVPTDEEIEALYRHLRQL
ncbi:c-type cytochrome [Deinococcus pimensis]|uniref:c-type cytochrome n=1 Tax=Deinococcus pimensis TaxID=309888 RepID=UPI0004ADCC39|nr:cytochrome c [Deinococcus pimensis]